MSRTNDRGEGNTNVETFDLAPQKSIEDSEQYNANEQTSHQLGSWLTVADWLHALHSALYTTHYTARANTAEPWLVRHRYVRNCPYREFRIESDLIERLTRRAQFASSPRCCSHLRK